MKIDTSDRPFTMAEIAGVEKALKAANISTVDGYYFAIIAPRNLAELRIGETQAVHYRARLNAIEWFYYSIRRENLRGRYPDWEALANECIAKMLEE